MRKDLSEELDSLLQNSNTAMLTLLHLVKLGSPKEDTYIFFWKQYPAVGQHQHGVGLAIKKSLPTRLTQTPIGICERHMSLRIPLASKRYASINH